jgi:hypothetical protein
MVPFSYDFGTKIPGSSGERRLGHKMSLTVLLNNVPAGLVHHAIDGVIAVLFAIPGIGHTPVFTRMEFVEQEVHFGGIPPGTGGTADFVIIFTVHDVDPVIMVHVFFAELSAAVTADVDPIHESDLLGKHVWCIADMIRRRTGAIDLYVQPRPDGLVS